MPGMKLFYEIVQIALETRDGLSRGLTDMEWDEVFAISQKQAVGGVLFPAFEEINKTGQRPPMDILYEWIGLSEQIKQQNLLLNKRCEEITQMFTNAGYESCILKGQGNALMYKKPESRTPGDIDIWVFGNRKDITRLVKEKTPNVFEQYHHIDFPIYDDAIIEVHYIPGSLLSPKYNKRFLEWCEVQKEVIKKSRVRTEFGFYIPSVEFNAVFQMAHIFTHFFTEGIGLRHFVDYFYVLKNLNSQKSGDVCENLRWLGLEKFAKGVMWVEKECLALDEHYLLFDSDKEIGEFIKKEMEEGGNFGQYDSRFAMRHHGFLARGIVDTGRLITLARMFPSESFWKVMEKIANQRWKLKKYTY